MIILNFPVFIKGIKDSVCVGQIGWQIFARITNAQKHRICQYLSLEECKVIVPHQSRFVLCKGRCTVGLYSLLRGLIHAKENDVQLAAYGMKIPL